MVQHRWQKNGTYKALIAGVVLLGMGLSSAWAQEAPVPRKSPRTPVHRLSLETAQAAATPASRAEGVMSVIDTEKLRIGDAEMRLFGVVPPQLTASYGPQARAALDALVTGKTVTCQIRDRGRDGRLLAVCKSGDRDLALDLLQRGLAVTARGSLSGSELSAAYLAAEQAAQTQRLGLWSGVMPAPAVVAAPPSSPAISSAAVSAGGSPAPSVAGAAKPDDKAEVKVDTKLVPVLQAAVKSPVPDHALPNSVSSNPAPINLALAAPSENFVQRYQVLISALLIVLTATGSVVALSIFRLRDKRQEMQAIAAALRGELMAARAVGLARIRTITSDADDRAMPWPRIRATLYQAYIGRLGCLGAELSRQIASIYGQTSDYAAYYERADDARTGTPKKQALETLVRYIEEVLPKLSSIEKTGLIIKTRRMVSPVTFAAATATAATAAAETMPTLSSAESRGTGQDIADPSTAAADVPVAAPVAAASGVPLWNAVRSFTREKMMIRRAASQEKPVDAMAEYAAILEEEMEGMSFTDDDLLMPSSTSTTGHDFDLGKVDGSRRDAG